MKKSIFSSMCGVLFGFLSIKVSTSEIPSKAWWHHVVCYEIYIRSFLDSKGSGVGDLKGIENKIPYLKELGVDVIWITPFYPSPDVDMGYDISNYRDVDVKFGTLSDFDSLIKIAHQHELKIMVDMVFSHTSEEHPWFIEAKQSKESPYHDYYVWHSPKHDGSAPNGWGSYFSGPAWEYNKRTDEYYLHIFAKEQPALNWDNHKVREELFNVAKFWLDRGVDGIRFDVISLIALPDISQSSDLWGKMPLTKVYLKKMDQEVLSKYNIFTVGEMPGITLETAHEYVSEESGCLNTFFHLDIMRLGNDGDKFHPTPYKLTDLKKSYRDWYKALYGKGWMSVVLGNHDEARAISRFGDDTKYWKQSGKMLATFLLTQWGIPYIFQGDEIGMTNCPFTPAELRDVEGINYYREKILEGKHARDVLTGLLARCRDNARTPMQWDGSKNASFTKADTPWLKVNPNYTNINVEVEERDPDSILHYYKKMIALRKSNPAFVYGTLKIIDFDHENIYAYTREYEGSKFLVICNFRADPVEFDTLEPGLEQARVLMHNYSLEPVIHGSKLHLAPFESIIFKI